MVEFEKLEPAGLDSPATNHPLLTLNGLAAYLQVSPGTLYTMRWRGEGPPATKVGSRLRFRQSDVDAWLDANVEVF